MRQSLGNDWWKEYITYTLAFVEFILKYSNSNKDFAVGYVYANTAHYLHQNQPDKYPMINSNDKNESLSTIIKKFVMENGKTKHNELPRIGDIFK